MDGRGPPSRGRDEGGGASNGYGGYNGYDYGERSSGERDMRRGGRAGVIYANNKKEEYGGEAAQQPSSRSQQSRGRPEQDAYTYARGNRNGKKNGPGTKKLDEILQIIEKDWDFMTTDTCVLVKVALQLMDTSSLGRASQYDSFQETHNELQCALQSIVNDHHQGFNSSIGTFHSIMRSITTSQGKVRALREGLIQAKSDLSTSRPEVKHMIDTSQKYDSMLQLLSSIEQLQLVPEKLEARISEKRFLTAVEVLSDALKVINRPEMMEIGALSDLRAYLGSQESSLADILIEELHNHLYLKSLYCVDRWKPYSPNQKDVAHAANGSTNGVKSNGISVVKEKRPLHKFLDSSDLSEPLTEDTNTNKNPEADSLYYIRLLLEALNNLGHLSNAIGTVNQRLPVELFKLVDKTNNEVDQRHPSSLTGVARNRGNNKTMDLGLSENDVRVTVIHDLLWTLYSKFEAVLEGHRIIYDVVRGICKREGSEDAAALTHGFVEVWQLIQSEMRSILHDYLTMNDSRNVASTPKAFHTAINNIVTGKLPRDKNKILFKLSGTDTTSSAMKSDQEDLESILKVSVPGLVSESLRPAATSSDAHPSADGAATGHKLLIEPNVFNMGLLLPPSLAFLNRIKDIIPTGSGIVLSTLTSFLDDFLVNVFHPSLEDTIRDLFNQTTGDMDAFQPDPQWASVAQKPVMKGTTDFLNLITAFCNMLETIPPDQTLGQLIIDLLTTYFDKCYEWYKELVSKRSTTEDVGGNPEKKSAQWAGMDEIRNAMSALWKDVNMSEDNLKKETEVQLAEKSDKPITYSDLITDRKIINSLCILYTSMKWFASKVVQLRHVEESETFSRNDGNSGGRRRRRWTLLEFNKTRDESRAVCLPMTADTVCAFDGVVTSFQALAETILFTLRAEARCHVLHHLHLCLKEGNYCLDNPVDTPDTEVLALNAGLIWFDEDTSNQLRAREHNFIFRGLGSLMDQILVSDAGLIKVLNGYGVQRMQLNILVLQQNLKNIEKGAELDRSARFYNLYNGGMGELMAKAKDGKLDFSYDDLKILVELYFSEAMHNRRESASALQARRSLNENLLELSEIMWSL
ncbi:exocyst subunit [Rhizina undulata]